jgi:hypothetical protein
MCVGELPATALNATGGNRTGSIVQSAAEAADGLLRPSALAAATARPAAVVRLL